MALILSHQTACEYWLSPYAKSAYRPDPDKVHLFADPNYLVSEKEHYCSQWSDAGKPSRTLRSNKASRVYGASESSSIIEPVSLRRNGKEATTPLTTKLAYEFFSKHRDIFSAPYHVLAMNADLRRRIKDVVFRTCSGKIPPNAFYRIETDVYVVSPEFCFVQLASELSLVQLVKLGIELTSQYVVMADNNLLYRYPVVNVDGIKRFQRLSSNMKGNRISCQAVQYIADNSASPRETDLLLLLCLPCRLGGFGFPLPQMNARVAMPSYYRHLFQGSYYVCDFLWKQGSVAIEYDSDEFHVGSDRIAHDSSRRTALSVIGVDVISVTNSQIKSKTEMNNIARLVSRKLDRSFRLARGYDYESRQQELRLDIFGSGSRLFESGF